MRTSHKEIVSANILGVTVGTTGKKGGDASYGCETFVEIKNLGATSMEIETFPEGVKVILRGDSELDTMIEALEFAGAELRKQRDL
jgi:hypothetical protein